MAYSSWTDNSLVRYFPTSPSRKRKPLRLDAARGEFISFQTLIHHDEENPVAYAVTVNTPGGISARVRRIGYVPVEHHATHTPVPELDGLGFISGLVPDPLLDERDGLFGICEAHSFHIKCKVAGSARPGTHVIHVTVTPEKGAGKPSTHAISLVVHDVQIKQRKRFPVTNWFYADALLDHYGMTAFENRFWKLLPAYFKNMTEHGQDTVYVPVFTPPLDGVK